MDNILLGIQLPSQSEIENQLKKITSDLSKLKNNQIIIDLTLKDNGIVDKIKNIDTVFKSLQNSAHNISFNSLVVCSIQQLNDHIALYKYHPFDFHQKDFQMTRKISLNHYIAHLNFQIFYMEILI